MEQSSSSALVPIAVGGFAGSACRHVLAVSLPAAFPWGTLAANAIGTFLLGVLLYDRRLGNRLNARIRLLVGTGFCSSFTTYSTFAAETVSLSPALAAANVAANYGLGFVAVLLGRAVARWRA
ncbi:fluoride efflux transporter FluC [Halovenus salina]|uniref:Fluoride-specific ion channel FluC n=1 Tax=Halovenus salina TaxID=1510225 RepID=A0ABD5W015_9EURY|nr:CrcB family protein [Halovenus salina]